VAAYSLILIAKEKDDVAKDVESDQRPVRPAFGGSEGLGGGHVANDPRRIFVAQKRADAGEDEAYDKQPADGGGGKPENPFQDDKQVVHNSPTNRIR
jgi:hypothetical protein